MNRIESKYKLLSFLSSADLFFFLKAYDFERLYIALDFMRNKGIKITADLLTEAALVKNSKKNIRIFNTKTRIDNINNVNRDSVLVKDLKNRIYLDEEVSASKISKNKDFLNKIKFFPKKTVLSYSIIITLSILPHAANSQSLTKYGLGKFAYMLGIGAMSTKKDAISVGYISNAEEVNATSLGSHTLAKRVYDIDLRRKIRKQLPKIYLLYKSILTKYRFAEVSVGGLSLDDFVDKHHLMKFSQITHVAPATKDTDAVNLFQTKNIIQSAVQKLQADDVDEHKKEMNYLKDEVDHVMQTIYLDKKMATEMADTTEDYKKETRLIIKKLKSNTTNIVKSINQDDDGTIHIGKALEGSTFSVAGNQGDRVISGVSQGVGNHDVANIGQLNQVNSIAKSAEAIVQKNTLPIRTLEHQLSKTNTKVERGLAASAALSGLFQPYAIGKVNVTAGIGGYDSSQAIAVGSGYRITDNSTVKVGLAYSGRNNVIYNASFNLKW